MARLNLALAWTGGSRSVTDLLDVAIVGAGVDGGLRGVITGIRMTEADGDACISKTANEPGCDLLDGNRDQKDADACFRGDQVVGVGFAHWPHQFGEVRPFARRPGLTPLDARAQTAVAPPWLQAPR